MLIQNPPSQFYNVNWDRAIRFLGRIVMPRPPTGLGGMFRVASGFPVEYALSRYARHRSVLLGGSHLDTKRHRKIALRAVLALLIAILFSAAGLAQESTYEPDAVIRMSYERIMSSQPVQRALGFLEQSDVAPSADGSSAGCGSLLANAGLERIHADEAGSVFGLLKGARMGDTVVVSAEAPAFATLLIVAQAFKVSGVRTVVDVVFRRAAQATQGAPAIISATGAAAMLREFGSVGAFVSLGTAGSGVIRYPLEGYVSAEAARKGLAVQAACAACRSLGVHPTIEALRGRSYELPPRAGMTAVWMGVGNKAGLKAAFLTILGIAGLDGVTTPFTAWSTDPCT